MDNSKPWYLSKTLWVQIIGAIALIVAHFSQPLSDFLVNNFGAVGGAWVAINFVLRLFTSQQIG